MALPFAVVGAAAGWLSDGLLANPLVEIVPRRSQGTAAVVAALIGAGLGAVLTRDTASRVRAIGARPLSLVWLAALVVGAGVCVGGTVGGLEMETSWGALSGALNGGLSALAFVPVCALVLASARRAERARQGSIVAGADRRAVWSILASAMAVTTLAAALDVPLAGTAMMRILPPPGLAMAVAAALVVLGVLVADVFAFLRVSRLGRADLEERDPAEAREAGVVPSIDLGLGEDVRARVLPAASAYRGRSRPLALLLGSAADARAALGRSILRGAAGLVLIGLVCGGHLWAETPAALLAFLEQRCERSPGACYEAGLLLLDRKAPESCPLAPAHPANGLASAEDVAHGEKLLQKGCEAANRCSCDALRQSALARGGEPRLPSWYVPR